VVPLTDYFLSELHLQEINEENFLGSKGEVVRAFAKLVKLILWLNEIFKLNSIGRYGKQISKLRSLQGIFTGHLDPMLHK